MNKLPDTPSPYDLSAMRKMVEALAAEIDKLKHERAYIPTDDEFESADRSGDKKVLLQHAWATCTHKQLVELLHAWHDRFYVEENRSNEQQLRAETAERTLAEQTAEIAALKQKVAELERILDDVKDEIR